MSSHLKNHADGAIQDGMARKQIPVSTALDPDLKRLFDEYLEAENRRLEQAGEVARVTKNSVHQTALREFFAKRKFKGSK